MPGPVNRGIARSVSIAVRQAVGGGAAIDFPFKLFRNGEQGAWYDPSDLTTLYQDAAGTIPVTADGQPVGRMEDKSGNENHATQAVAAARPVYQRGDSRGVVNLLKWSEGFDNSAWTAGKTTGASVTPNTTIAPDGTLTADTVTFASSGDFLIQSMPKYPAVSGQSVTFSLYAKTATQLIIFGGATPAGSSVYSVTTEPSGWFRQSVTRTFSVTTSTQTLQLLPHGGVAGAGSYQIWGAQLEQNTTATAYQRNDSHLGGVATGAASDLHWLADDKVDDEMTATLPAMPTATVARATDDGVTIDYPVNIPAGSYSIDNSSTQGFEYGRIIVDRQLTAPEQAALITYLEGKS